MTRSCTLLCSQRRFLMMMMTLLLSWSFSLSFK
ncbi:hypothetical protein M6B38_397980 [Iris pallida]|uniref:Uncharacterized protein n=1 Tax=Iris pallida TaxID=29817 RepID=A0AAX6FVA5_IRIPA|nr:hypothetical protein M6B38_402265 [Iris pallida]KAJ6820217.1 hypothetical protein M6B38_397975 [Iris pallida]KAJ6820218.1 hypothetical protein M6B38_397980 [Iris pallida]